MSGDGGGSDGGCVTCRRTDQISVFLYHQISILKLMETRFLSVSKGSYKYGRKENQNKPCGAQLELEVSMISGLSIWI